MNAWFKDQKVKNVKMLPDGNGYFARLLGMYVNADKYGFGLKVWRSAFLTTRDMRIERMFAEPNIEDNLDHDPYGESSPANILEYLRRQKAGEDLKTEWLYPDNVAKAGEKTRVFGENKDT